MTCRAWGDHDWGSRQFLEAGRHPVRGFYQQYRIKCRACGKEAIETTWVATPTSFMLPPAQRPETT